MTYDRAAIWIKYASVFLGLSGLVVLIAVIPGLRAVPLLFADIIFWPVDGGQSLAAPETQLVSAIGGGVMIGWGVVFWMLADQGFSQAPDLSRRIILTSIWIWFIADSAASVLAGAPLNAVSNLVYLALFAVPLARISPEISPQAQAD